MRSLLFFSLFFFGCSQNPKTLPSCTGQNAEVVFVMDDFLWEGPAKLSISRVFGEEIIGVNQPEKLFRIIQVNHQEFKSILKTHTNIVIVSSEISSFRQTNKWATGQYVAGVCWEGSSEMFHNTLLELRSTFIFKEREFLRKSLLKRSQKNVQNARRKNFEADCIIPEGYQVIKNTSSIFWANYDPIKSEEIKNIITFSFGIDSLFNHEEVLKKTDSVFAKHLKGHKEGTYVRIEPEYKPHYSQNIHRGLWKLENGFMGGPFIIKSYHLGNKIIVNAGLVFAPQSRKRKYIKEFEAIL